MWVCMDVHTTCIHIYPFWLLAEINLNLNSLLANSHYEVTGDRGWDALCCLSFDRLLENPRNTLHQDKPGYPHLSSGSLQAGFSFSKIGMQKERRGKQHFHQSWSLLLLACLTLPLGSAWGSRAWGCSS